ncbi:HAD hydrolase-like protein [Halobacillus shinanisalinarum]|uniref:HAD hydrolase-like protein n=1 Tax=Halobacillus shinanisalinarum TaxID=2932258 RepID=A0ABY4GVG1_9BACI|nr:HAD hydrolase-like protein [Halobacillus shinanisalinarum]UOQ92156.1 HAD hydrolase-like protein [Halobacillus shinanisalinarum]
MSFSFIFDMDGTLFQTNKILELSLQDAFDRLRSMDLWKEETPIQQYREIMGVPLPEVWETLLPDHSNKVREITNDHFHKCLIANIKGGSGELYPNVEKVLRYLKENNYPIFIASNGLTEYLNTIVDYYQLNNWIVETFSIQNIASQDKADLVGEIVKKYDIDQAAVVGDRLSDFRAAKTNGMLSIGCTFDFAKEEELQQANLTIDNLSELIDILPRLREVVQKVSK